MGMRAHARFAHDIAISSPIMFPSPCIFTIFSVGGVG